MFVIQTIIVSIVSDEGAPHTACNIVQIDGQAGRVFLPSWVCVKGF